MSIDYAFVTKTNNPDRAKLQEVLTAGQLRLKNELRELRAACPNLGEDIDRLISDVQYSDLFRVPTSGRSRAPIGVATNNKFYWNTEYGFTGLESVRDYAARNPEQVIENEYGDQISLADFEATYQERYQ